MIFPQSLNRVCSKQVREEDIHERGAEKSVWLKAASTCLSTLLPLTFSYTHACIHSDMGTHQKMHECKHTHTCLHILSKVHTHLYTHTGTHLHLPVYPCTHMHTGTSTYTHILPAKQDSKFHEAGTMVYLLVYSHRIYKNSAPSLVHKYSTN